MPHLRSTAPRSFRAPSAERAGAAVGLLALVAALVAIAALAPSRAHAATGITTGGTSTVGGGAPAAGAPGVAGTGGFGGRFQITLCRTAFGSPADASFVKPYGGGGADGCGLGGTFNVTAGNYVLAATTDQRYLGFDFDLASANVPNTKIVGATADVAIASKSGDSLSNANYAIHTEAGEAYREDIPAGDWGGRGFSAVTASTPGGTRFARFLMWCYWQCRFPAGPSMSLRSATLTLEEKVLPNPPSLESIGLFDGSAQRGTRRVRLSVSDGDSGVDHVELYREDGSLLAQTTAGAGCSTTRPNPCPSSRAQEELLVDTTTLPEGSQQLDLWVIDGAGNVFKKVLPAITVRNAAPVAPTPVPPTATPVPATQAPAAATPTPPQAPVLPGGGTVATSPTPTALSSTPKPTPAPITAAQGEPSPTVAPSSALSAAVAFKVPAGRVRSGQTVELSGAVVPAPAEPQRLVIEAKKGKKWLTAAIVKTRDGGTFRWSHRFRTRGSYTMRARLLASVDSKLPAAISPARSFRVR